MIVKEIIQMVIEDKSLGQILREIPQSITEDSMTIWEDLDEGSWEDILEDPFWDNIGRDFNE